MQFGTLTFKPASGAPELLAAPTKHAVAALGSKDIWVSEIDPALADTAAFCANYAIGMEVSANCVVVEATRANKTWYAACLILATDKADINGAIRGALDARKVSFAPMDTALRRTSMEYGGITPLGLPADWPIFIDTNVAKQEKIIIGSGIRGSKILITPPVLATLPNAKVMDIAK